MKVCRMDGTYSREPLSAERGTATDRGVSFREDLAVDRRSATLKQAARQGVRLVSLGGDSLVEAEPVRNSDSER